MYVHDSPSSCCASNVCCGIYIQGQEGRRQRERGKKGGRERERGRGREGEGEGEREKLEWRERKDRAKKNE